MLNLPTRAKFENYYIIVDTFPRYAPLDFQWLVVDSEDTSDIVMFGISTERKGLWIKFSKDFIDQPTSIVDPLVVLLREVNVEIARIRNAAITI